MLNSVVAILNKKTGKMEPFLDSMASAMKSRGQIGEKFIVDRVALANAVSDITGEYSISFDGTLYGVNNPAQVVIEAYKERGEKCLRLFDGCFAFCLWDSKKEKLFVARDQYGVRPLYYSFHDGVLAFASQINALLKLRKHKLNKKRVCDYLVEGWFSTNEETFFQGVKEMLPGHYMLHSRENSVILQPFCSYPDVSFSNHKNHDTSVTEFLKIFKLTLQKMTPSLGKYGTSTSGGLDSALIASIFCKNDRMRRHRMYSVVCDGASEMEAEAPYIVDFEKFINRKINYIKVPLPPAWSELKQFVNLISEPTPLASQFMSWAVCRRAKHEGVQVIFTGLEADNFLCSMPHTQRDYIRYLWKNKRMAILFREAVGLIVHSLSYRKTQQRFIPLVQEEVKKRLLLNRDSSHLLDENFVKEMSELAELNFDGITIDQSIIGNIMFSTRFMDRIYASQGIEPLHPFLDKTLSDYMASLPMDMKIKYGIRKYVLRISTKGLLPESIRKSTVKFGSSIPLANWLIGWEPQITELINSEDFTNRGFYNSKKINTEYAKLLEDNMDPIKAYNMANKLWRVINFELWLQQQKS